jgi:hypothetical protein
VWVERLEEGRGGELRVEGQQVVQVGGPASVVPQDEQRGLDTGGLDLPPEPLPLQAGTDRVGHADGGLDQRTGRVPQVDGEAVPAQ